MIIKSVDMQTGSALVQLGSDQEKVCYIERPYCLDFIEKLINRQPEPEEIAAKTKNHTAVHKECNDWREVIAFLEAHSISKLKS